MIKPQKTSRPLPLFKPINVRLLRDLQDPEANYKKGDILQISKRPDGVVYLGRFVGVMGNGTAFNTYPIEGKDYEFLT
jgi:hypothetical protein